MTLCAFIHPPGFPTLITDLIVSREGVENVITPSNIGLIGVDNTYKPVTLVRKSLYLDDGPSLFGFAGDADAISDFQRFLPLTYRTRESGTRPMRHAGDIANRFNEDFGKLAISLIGFSRQEATVGYKVNILAGAVKSAIKTHFFNEVYAIGTGADEFLDLVRRFDNDLVSSNLVDAGPTDNLIGLLGALNSHKIFNDSPGILGNTWGGYLEAATLADGHKRLEPVSWTHLAYRVYMQNGIRKFKKLGKQLHYIPRADNPCIGIRIEDGHKKVDHISWRIQELDRFQETTDEERVGSIDHWSDFQPDAVSLCLWFDGSSKILYRTLSQFERASVKVDGNMNFSVEEKTLRRITKGLNYLLKRVR